MIFNRGYCIRDEPVYTPTGEITRERRHPMSRATHNVGLLRTGWAAAISQAVQ